MKFSYMLPVTAVLSIVIAQPVFATIDCSSCSKQTKSSSSLPCPTGRQCHHQSSTKTHDCACNSYTTNTDGTITCYYQDPSDGSGGGC